MDNETSIEDPGDDWGESIRRRVGERIREVRLSLGLTLEGVTAVSQREIKMSTLGSYERGERTITVSRLYALAELYDVPVHELLPERVSEPADDTIDLRDQAEPERTEAARLTEATQEALIHEFVRTVRSHRSASPSGRAVRRDDVQVIADLLDLSPSEVRLHLRAAVT